MKRFDQINVIPFIDVMLVLLAIVLTTATFVAQGTIPVNLPVSQSASKFRDQKPVEITIDEQGIYPARTRGFRDCWTSCVLPHG